MITTYTPLEINMLIRDHNQNGEQTNKKYVLLSEYEKLEKEFKEKCKITKMVTHIAYNEDGTLFEWIDRNYRFGIFIDNNINDSSWYFVSNTGIMESGELPQEFLSYFRKGE